MQGTLSRILDQPDALHHEQVRHERIARGVFFTYRTRVPIGYALGECDDLICLIDQVSIERVAAPDHARTATAAKKIQGSCVGVPSRSSG